MLSTFNGRDQVTFSRQFAGTTSSTTYQDTTASYDGFGRKVGQKLPQQDSPGTAFTYNPDGSVLTQTDARGVVTNFEYNNRGLTTGISWDVGSTGVTDTPDVEIEYDNLGDRTEMTDGLGTQVYEYDALSRLTAEIREFDDTLTNAPISGNKFRLEYSYHMSGQLKSLTDPFGQQFNYGYDRVSRLESVTGSTSFGGLTDYASNAQYRAWGALKGLESGNGVSMQTSFDAALRPSEYELKDSANDTAIERSYEYYNDGALKYLEDHMSPKFDRFNMYDHQGRITQGKSGLEARGGSVTDPEVQKQELPYRQSYQYNAFNNMTQRLNLHWGSDSFGYSNFNLNYTYENNRVTNSWWQHDADGRVTQSAQPDDHSLNSYDARGSLIKMQVQPEGLNATETTRNYSGDARELKRSVRRMMDEEEPPYGSYWEDDPPKYYVRSSVLGGEVVSEADETGQKKKTFVMAAGARVATQAIHYGTNGPVESLWFEHAEVSGMSSRSSWHNGLVNGYDGMEGSPAETDPMGGNVGMSDPYFVLQQPTGPEWLPEPYQSPIEGGSNLMVNGMSVPCTLDGMTINCSTALGMLGHSANIDFANTDRWLLSQAGIFAYPTYRYKDVSTPDPPDGGEGSIKINIQNQRIFDGWAYSFGVSWAPQRFVRIEIPINLREQIKERLGNGKCNDFIKRLIAEARGYTQTNTREIVKRDTLSPDLTGHEEPYAIDGFELLGKIREFSLRDFLKVGNRNVGGTIEGHIPDGNASVLMASRFRTQKESNRSSIKLAERAAHSFYVTTAIHEIIHHAGYYFGDALLARVLFDMGELDSLPTNEIGETASDKFGDVVTKYCGENQ